MASAPIDSAEVLLLKSEKKALLEQVQELTDRVNKLNARVVEAGNVYQVQQMQEENARLKMERAAWENEKGLERLRREDSEQASREFLQRMLDKLGSFRPAAAPEVKV